MKTLITNADKANLGLISVAEYVEDLEYCSTTYFFARQMDFNLKDLLMHLISTNIDLYLSEVKKEIPSCHHSLGFYLLKNWYLPNEKVLAVPIGKLLITPPNSFGDHKSPAHFLHKILKYEFARQEVEAYLNEPLNYISSYIEFNYISEYVLGDLLFTRAIIIYAQAQDENLDSLQVKQEVLNKVREIINELPLDKKLSLFDDKVQLEEYITGLLDEIIK